MLNEPQGFIFHLYHHGVQPEEAATQIRYKFNDDQYNPEWVQHLYDSFDILDQQHFTPPDFTKGALEALKYKLPKSRNHSYRFGSKTFSISYADPALELYIHYSFAHLAVEPIDNPDLKLEVFHLKGRFALRINGNRCLMADESPQMKRLLFVELAGYLWEKGEGDWISHLHASAVVCNDRVIMFASPSGSGKSTLAALMMKRGCRLFADDYIPVSLDKRMIHPFPAALSVKAGSMPVMAAEGIPVDLIRWNMGYIQQNIETLSPLHAHVMVFVRYQKDANTRMEKISPAEALQPFLQESWVTNTLQGAEAFWEWFTGLSFYSLEYSNNDQAVEASLHIPYPSL